MKNEKICAGILLLLVVLFCVVYFTLPKQGEQIYIPQETNSVTPPIEIPDGYKLVDNYSDVYYVETEDGYRFFWLVQFSDGSYGWQEVDENGNIILPGHSGAAETTPETTEHTEQTEATDMAEPAQEETAVPESSE